MSIVDMHKLLGLNCKTTRINTAQLSGSLNPMITFFQEITTGRQVVLFASDIIMLESG